MTASHSKASYKTYLGTWFALLVLTVGMLVTGYLSVSRAVLVLVLVVAMLAKASLIGAYFMHLRFERKGLILSVVLGLLTLAGIMFGVMALDGLHVLNLLAY